MNKFKGLISIGLAISLLVGCGNGGDTPKSNASKDILPQIEKLVSEEKFGEANDLILETVENNIQPIYDEWETLKNEVNTYEKYVESQDKLTNFYEHASKLSENIFIDIHKYALSYANSINDLDIDFEKKYDYFDKIYDSLYVDAPDVIYDNVYNGVSDDFYDYYYNEIPDQAPDNVLYSKKWSDDKQNSLNLWSDTRQDILNLWSDTRQDILNLWSDTRQAMLNENTEEATKVISNFEKLVDKRKSGDWEDKKEEPKKSENEKEEIKETVKEEPQQTQPSTTSDVREFLDSYEQFMNQYVEFMKTFDADSSTPEMLSEYSNLMKEFAEFGEKAESYNTDNISDEDYAYYLEVMARIQQKMLEVM